MTPKTPLTYKESGVDIDAGEKLVGRIKAAVERTTRPEVLGGLGGFGGLFKLPLNRYKNPILVAGVDGVGTKLKLAIEHDAHDQIGIDLVAMSVNDVIVQGAEPLFFLDYYVSQRLDIEIATRVIKGIAHGCELSGAALIGGETAEHPGMHAKEEYDLAGFCVGIVEADRLLDGSSIRAGDSVIGIASSGPHSNGFSLIRSVLAQSPLGADTLVNGQPVIDQLLAPTRIYSKSILHLLESIEVKGLAHITGGGLTENIPRVLPSELGAQLERSAWPTPEIFKWIESMGVETKEMLRTFNCGIGMVVIVKQEVAENALSILKACGENAWIVGDIVKDRHHRAQVI
jgi:phosphoribosylformylglycinamidine cyclo-ligase